MAVSTASLPSVRFGDAVAATFYHGFNRTRATERTTIRLTFERGQATIEGWIPTSMHLEGDVSEDSLAALAALIGQDLRSARASLRTGGAVPIQATVERPDRQADYRLAIRAGMGELVAAILRGRTAVGYRPGRPAQPGGGPRASAPSYRRPLTRGSAESAKDCLVPFKTRARVTQESTQPIRLPGRSVPAPKGRTGRACGDARLRARAWRDLRFRVACRFRSLAPTGCR